KPKADRTSPGNGSAEFSTPWTDSDDWVVDGQELVQPDDSPGWHTIYFGDLSWTDYNFEADVKIINRGSKAGLFFRATDSHHVLVAELHPGTEGVREKGTRGVLSRNGRQNPIYVHSLVVTETIKGRWYHMRVEARGNRFTMLVDGTNVTSVYNEDHPRGCVG